MSFRATKANEYDRAKSKAADVKRICGIHRAAMAAGPVSANVVKELLLLLVDADAVFSEVAAVSGIAAYAQAQEGDENYDVAAEFTAMRSAVQGARDWIIANMPKNVGGMVLLETWGTSGVSVRTFSTAETANLRTVLDTLIATID